RPYAADRLAAAAAAGTDGAGLEQPLVLEARLEVRQLLGAELLTGLIRVRPDLADSEGAERPDGVRPRLVGRAARREQRLESPAQPARLLSRHGRPPGSATDTRRSPAARTSRARG